MTLFESVLVANRGEIARRIIRTLSTLGIRSIAVYSDADVDEPHVREADEAVRIGPAPAIESYLNVDAIIDAARVAGAAAVHPGYGFLSESVALARSCDDAGLVFIGPGISALEIMGDKARSRTHVETRGVTVVPGFDAAGLEDSEIALRATETGYPLLVKPSAGGGGKGMEVVPSPEALQDALSSARRVAAASFGDDGLVIERLITRPRHIEVQVFGDTHGRVACIGERECTLQRRHQKVIEEAPAPGLSAGLRERLWTEAALVAASVDYVGAGTVEFIVDADDDTQMFFIEMNTRLQVEHPVTEEVTGLDLVELQLRIAAGEPLPDEIPAAVGHAIEARVYAESPERGFLPSVGRILRFDAPRGARVDAAVETGSDVSAFYDPMIAKVIVRADDRRSALSALDAALARTVVLGVETNVAFLRTLCRDERVVAGDVDTGLIATLLPIAVQPPSAEALAVARLAVSTTDDAARDSEAQKPGLANSRIARGPGEAWDSLPGWRMTGSVAHGDGDLAFMTDDGSVVIVDDSAGTPVPAADAATAWDLDGAVWVADQGRTVRLHPLTRRQRMQHRLAAKRPAALTDSEARAPMPGGVVAAHVPDGAHVSAGDVLITIEAMKMEHPVVAPRDGIVQLLVASGDQVRRDQTVARLVEENE